MTSLGLAFGSIGLVLVVIAIALVFIGFDNNNKE